MLEKSALLQKNINGELLFNEPMKNHTSFRVGGCADALLLPNGEQDIITALDFCRENALLCLIIGNGSNLLVSDDGVRGLVIKTAGRMNNISLNSETEINAGCGCLLSQAAAFALSAGLSGLEFASGIPGSVGGAVYMNAGAYGGEIKDVLTRARVITGVEADRLKYESHSRLEPSAHITEVVRPLSEPCSGMEPMSYDIKELYADELEFGHRSSIFQKNDWVVTGAVFKLTKGEPLAIETKMKEFNAQRREKQPLDAPSAGSVFKRPLGHFAGKLIEDCGLAGYSIGGATVSPKHCGFIVNNGTSAADIYKLIKYVEESVYVRFGVKLQPEIRFIGKFE